MLSFSPITVARYQETILTYLIENSMDGHINTNFTGDINQSDKQLKM